MYEQRFRVADVSQMADQTEVVYDLRRLLRTAFHTERQHAAETVAEVFLRQRVVLAAFESRIADVFDLGMLFQPLRDRKCVVHAALYAQRERFESLRQQERVERADAGADVAQPFAAGAGRKGGFAALFPEIEAVIPLRGFAQQRISAVAPVCLLYTSPSPRDA